MLVKIIAPNSQFSGLRAGIPFVNGVSETDNEYLIGWFKENGYTVMDPAKLETSGMLPSNEELKQENDNQDFSKMVKKDLQEIARNYNLEFTDRTTNAQLIEMIKVAQSMED